MKRFSALPLYRPDNDELRFLPEGPRVLRYSPDGSQMLAWVAIQHGPDRRDGSLNLLSLDAGVNTNLPLNGRPGFFVETTRVGVLLVGLERRFVLVDLRTGDVQETEIVVTDDERVIINDGIAIPGGLLFGTKHLKFQEPVAALYHYDCSTRELRKIVDSQICSNGKHFQRDAEGVTIVDIDTSPKAITRYRMDASLQRILKQELVVSAASLPAFPDGLRPSPDGTAIIVAFYNPDHVDAGVAQEIRLSDGVVLTEWVLPESPRVTCPELAIIRGKVQILFTTAVEGMPQSTQRIAPQAGTIFSADTPFTSLPELPPLFPLEAIL